MTEEGIENPNKKELATSLTEDPRFEDIKKELVDKFGESTGKDILSAEGQNFQYGDPAALRNNKTPISLAQRTEEAFQERFPEDAKKYRKMEEVKVYERPEDDPVIGKTFQDITRKANKDIQASGEHTFDRSLSWQSNASIHKWLDFIRQYPEKSAAYKETFEPIKNAFETQERITQREKAESERLAGQRKLENGYSQLENQNSVLKRIEKDQESLFEVRKKLGIPIPKNEIRESEGFAKIEKIKEQIAEAEIDFLDLPENIESGQDSKLEDFANSEEFLKLQEELEESSEEAREKFIENTTNDTVNKWSEEFKNAENGEVAEKLFRLKFPVYFRENLKNSSSDVTYTVFYFKTIKNSSGREIFYFEKIDIQNLSRDAYLEKTREPKYNERELEKNPNFDEKADPKLVSKKDIKTLGDLMKEKRRKDEETKK